MPFDSPTYNSISVRMPQPHGRERTFPPLHNVLRMLLSPGTHSKPGHGDNDLTEEADEPPDQRIDDGVVYIKSPTVLRDPKESLLTRALKSNSPELSPSEQPYSPTDNIFQYRSSYPQNHAGVPTADLTSDGGPPSLSNSPSPPFASQFTHHLSPTAQKPASPNVKTADRGESQVEANLGRKRCISFACGAQSKEPQPAVDTNTRAETAPPEPPKRQRTISFACCPVREPGTRRERSPSRRASFKSRPRGSPAPFARKASLEQNGIPSTQASKDQPEKTASLAERRGIQMTGLGKFEASEQTRFHEFASSVDEDPEWVTNEPEHTDKITLNDCLKKENAIRRLGEEAEEEAREDEEEEDEDEDADDLDDDDSTDYDFSDDEGNESDNEAGFAESDDESEKGSDSELWVPSNTATPSWNLNVFHRPDVDRSRRDSYTSADSANEVQPFWLSTHRGRNAHRTKSIKMRPGTPKLPDSTDFVCGTLDEDRPLEAAYKSCLEQRRLSKQIPIPQDIDPSFPAPDPEEEDSSDSFSDDEAEEGFNDDISRGRHEQARKASPLRSPKRLHSPPPRRHGRSSPKRLRSPPPPKGKSPPPAIGDRALRDEVPSQPHVGFNISGLVQRPIGMARTKSLPRTPNPFFSGLDSSRRWSCFPPLEEYPSREQSRTREVHTRGPVDIVEGLERKRQKRKEKFWRQHCRKIAKEEMERRPVPGKGAERMKELGLEAAERCRAYGVSQDAQLVISV